MLFVWAVQLVPNMFDSLVNKIHRLSNKRYIECRHDSFVLYSVFQIDKVSGPHRCVNMHTCSKTHITKGFSLQ